MAKENKLSINMLNFEEIFQILKLQLKYRKTDAIFGTMIGDKNYKISFGKYNKIQIDCSDGRRITFDIFSQGRDQYSINIKVIFPMKDYIEFCTRMDFNDTKTLPVYTISYRKDISTYLLNGDLELPELTINDDSISLKFREAKLTKDGQTVLELDGKPVSSTDTKKPLDAKSIAKKIILFKKSTQVRAKALGLDKYIKDFLEDALSTLEKDSEKNKKTKEDKKAVLFMAQDLLAIHDRIHKIFPRSVFSKEELTKIASLLEEKMSRNESSVTPVAATKTVITNIEDAEVTHIKGLIKSLNNKQKSELLAYLYRGGE